MLKGTLLAAMLGTACVNPDPSGSDGGASGGTSSGPGYAWAAGRFSGCSLPCGGGVQERSVSCRAGDGSVASDSLCAGAKPDDAQACNTQSCTSTSCTPAVDLVHATQLIAISPTDGPGPLTVTLDVPDSSYDYIDFGDGTRFAGPLTFVGDVACVTHTFVASGTYRVGRTTGNAPTTVELDVEVR
jgi:hypothetical protein